MDIRDLPCNCLDHILPDCPWHSALETLSATQEAAQPPTVGEIAAAIAAKIRGMSGEEFRQSLVRAGIIDRNGQLTEKYKPRI